MISPKTLTFLHPQFRLSAKHCWVLIMLHSDTQVAGMSVRIPQAALCPQVDTAPHYCLTDYLKSWLCKTRTGSEAFGTLTGPLDRHQNSFSTVSDSRGNPNYCDCEQFFYHPAKTWTQGLHLLPRGLWGSQNRTVGSKSYRAGKSTYANPEATSCLFL